MNNIRLKYGSCEFAINPSKLEVKRQRTVSSAPLLKGVSVTDSVAVLPIKVKGNGRMVCKNAEEECEYISSLLGSGSSKQLFCPGLYPIKAFLTEFTYSLDAEKEGAEYSFEFTEDCADTLYERKIDYVNALEGENAFELANRTGVSVSEIMRLNCIASPFELTAGERVYINGN